MCGTVSYGARKAERAGQCERVEISVKNDLVRALMSVSMCVLVCSREEQLSPPSLKPSCQQGFLGAKCLECAQL